MDTTLLSAHQALVMPHPFAEILIVDDDEEIRLLTAYHLQQMGYRVALASDANEAREVIALRATRVMITDALMPGVDGREFCKRIKREHPEIKVVIMSSLYASPRYQYEAFKTFQADEYLTKPIDFERLGTVMQKLSPVQGSLR